MDLISAGKSTHLVSFETLKSKFTYHHVENAARDFSFLGKRKLFLEANHNAGFEMLRLKTTENNRNEIHLVRKMKVENLLCLSCPRQTTDFVAVGLASGQVNLVNYRNSEYIAKFPAESTSNGAIFLDFNASDEYLSTVYENGLINIYGLKTKTKLESLKLDKNSTLARFHPLRRFHLSVASYTGAVCIYDMQSKRKIFKATDSHGAPCRDLCISPTTPDVLLSVGYDCILNIFDIRRKLSPQQIRSSRPLSAVCISECGKYCVAGNLKGELISYDLRNLKECLECDLVHDSAVVRVGFVPTEGESNLSLSNLETPENILTETQNLQPLEDNAPKPRRDSFLDFINCQSFKGRESLMRRDSSFLPNPERKHFDFDLRANADGRCSVDGRFSMELKSINDLLPDSTAAEVPNAPSAASKFRMRRSSFECFVSEKRQKPRIEDDFIEEEVFEDAPSVANKSKDTPKPNTTEKKLDVSATAENNDLSKENENLNTSRKEINYLVKLPDDKNSTPNPARRYNVADDGAIQANTVSSSVETKAILGEIQNLREEMNSKLKELEFEVKFHADKNKSDFFLQNFNLWKNQMNVTEDVHALLSSLLHTDPFVMEFMKLKEENARLKEEINSIRKVR